MRVPARRISVEELRICHSKSLLELLQSTKEMSLPQLKETSAQFDCLYIHPDSWETALLSAGGVVDLVQRVVSGDVR